MQCKIFSHRGLVSDFIGENTIKSLINAADNGYEAIEFDIFFCNKMLVLSHNQPESEKGLDKLENFLAIFADQMEYWLDFKNLDQENVFEAMDELKKIIDKNKINLKKLYFAPYIIEINDRAQAVYKAIRQYFGDEAQIIAVKEKLKPADYQNYYMQLKEHNIYGLSIQFKNITADFMQIFSDIKIFAWTVDRKKDCKTLEQLGVSNIASNKLLPYG